MATLDHVRLDALIFDVDGTLANTEEMHRLSFNEAFHGFGLDWFWSADVYKHLLKTTGGKERIAAFVSTLDISPATRAAHLDCIPALHRAKTALYTQRVRAGNVELREGITRLITEAQAAGVRIAIATTTSFENVRVLLESALGAKALDRFAAIGAGDQVLRKKPAPDVYLSVLEELKVAPDHCVAFEDSANGLAAAKAAGLFTVVTPSYWTQEENFQAADLVLPTLGDAGAPLPPEIAAQLGAPWLSLPQLEQQLMIRRRSARRDPRD